ncbi:carbohydrate kinase family protein [Phormidium tenue FACHB-886]|nr:carbohydrate kinase family protein [Phormidium tenue FACHB-886]
MPPTLLAAGYLNLDLVAVLDRLPAFGERETAQSLTRSSGGMTANLACAAAQLGLSVQFFGTVGKDPAGATALAELEQFGVQTNGIIRSDRPTTIALILLNPEGERAIISEPFAFDYSTLTTALTVTPPSACLHLDGYRLPEGMTRLQQAKSRGLLTSADLDGIEPDAIAAVSRQAAPDLDVVFINRRLAEKLANSPADAAQFLLRSGAKTVAVTLAEQGALIASEEGEEYFIPALVDAVVRDTTGAGDVFAGAFLAAWLQGRSIQFSGQFAVTASGLSLDSYGARGHLPTWDEVTRRMPAI